MGSGGRGDRGLCNWLGFDIYGGNGNRPSTQILEKKMLLYQNSG